MGLRIFLSIFLLFAKGYDVSAQCRSRVEFSSPPATLSTTSYIQPSGQFVIPAVIKPLLSPVDPYLEPPIVPSFPDPNSFNYPMYPPAMPAYFIAERDNDDLRDLLYALILSLTKKYSSDGYGGYCDGCGCGGCSRCGGGCGGSCGCGGSSGCGGSCGYGGDYSCGGNYGNGGGCGCGGNGKFGGGYGNGGSCSCGGNCGCVGNSCCRGGCGNGGGFDFFGGCGFNNFNGGNGVTFVPYPIIVPMNCMNPGCFYNDDDFISTCQAGKDSNEISLIIRADTCQ